MAAITIRQLPDDVKRRLRMRAAARGTSMEAEARAILLAELARPAAVDLAWVEDLIAAGENVGGVEVPLLADEPATAAHLTS